MTLRLRLSPIAAAHLLGVCLLTGCGDDSGGSGSGSGSGSGVGGSGGADATSVSNAGVGGSGNPIQGETGNLVGITEAHNQARANVSPAAASPIPDLAWDDDIAAVAQAYAEQCIFEHSGVEGYGENLAANAGSPVTAASRVQAWVAESANYDYGSNTCTDGAVCGHYTQVVWADSLKVGCGYAECTVNSPFADFPTWENWVCNYGPPGNWIGERPY